LRVSDIGFGVAISTDPQLLVDAYHRGINYFDISPSYTWSVEMLAAAFARDAEMRKETIVASKVECGQFMDNFRCFSQLDQGHHNPAAACVDCIDETLKALGRSHIDILQLHAVGQRGETDLEYLDPNTPKGSNVLELFEILKRQGKVRFAGISTHGPKFLDVAVERAVESGHFDMVMPALNFMQTFTPTLSRSLRTAEERTVGVTAMKVLANGDRVKIRSTPGRPLSHAAIAWVLGQPGVNNLVISIDSWEKLDEYLGASAHELSSMDRMRLARHRAATSRQYCRVDCGLCRGSCPSGVDVASLLRIDQYRSCYGRPGMARDQYLAFSGHGSLHGCMECRDPVCEAACPFRLPLRSRLRLAHRHLDPNGAALS
jgi:predicted aldo/keto reductase-like oxidoreductase